MIHWIEATNRRGLDVWLRYVETPWGLIFTGEHPRWHVFGGYGGGVIGSVTS